MMTPNKEKKKYPVCPRCKTEMDSRVSRGMLVKSLLFFLPLKRYKCFGCGRKTYAMN